MASLHPPVPSIRLLRFLRLQSENLSFFNPNHDSTARLGQVPRKVLCAAKRYSRASRADTSEVSQDAPLQAGILDLDSLLQQGQAPKNVRKKSLPYFSPNITVRYNSSNRPSTPCPPTWRERLWGFGTGKNAKPLEPDDLPDADRADNNSMFNMRRQLSQKAALEPRLRCTEVDENGNVILVDGEFKKSELIARFGLLPRDLRKIDSSNLPHILVRPTAILLNLLHLKVLIKYNRVLLFDVYGSKASYPQSAFMYDLQGKLQQKATPGNTNLPYEFRALEAVLQSVTQELEADFEAVREPVIRILSELEDDIDRHKLRILLVLSKRVSTFEQKAKLVRDAIEELLEADDDLASMYLTEKTHDLHRNLDDHTEVEMLLESYHKLCDEIVQEAQNLVSSIRNTEEIIRAILDANRNSLMLLDLKFSVGTLGLAMGTFIAGLYGMNLENFIEETHWGFGAVTGASIIFSLIVCKYGLAKLKKVQRVKMQGEDRKGLDNEYHWFHDEGNVGLLDPRNREMLRRLNMKKADMAMAEKRRRWGI
ncbi:cora-domain-containing protein [Hypoxylon trugodes]|uniref:cora-domain-containing protein n=1 Tax=Hypoxylon trugodes TaxID=326681 RepID=UPI00219BBDD1|nr:cora-domain-containing protein [Hypoxylon trugodes]KAI1392432.1 cora-domain-containing protein [Hypoxylon trugodes]